MKGGEIRYEECKTWFHSVCEQQSPALVMGTSFAWVHLLDEMKSRGHSFKLPEGSRIMETGGFKGRSREVVPEELHRWMGQHLGIHKDDIINEYGMTELMSQLYSIRDMSDGRLGLPPDEGNGNRSRH